MMCNYSLKPCPFCGGKAKMFGGLYSQEAITIMCTGCYAKVGGTMDEEQSIQRWNIRIYDE